MASAGPVVDSAITRSGRSDSTLSAETSCPRVTTGSRAACSKVAVTSRATTREPSPRVNTISLRLPESGTSRSARSTVTFRPSAERTVTGRAGSGGPARGSTRSGAAEAPFAGGEAVPSDEPWHAVAVRVRASTDSSAPASRMRKRRTVVSVPSGRGGWCLGCSLG